MADTIKILGICGSLRKNSYNKMALLAAVKNIPTSATIEIVDIGDLPFFNQDLEENPPESVKMFRDKVRNSDAILFAVNEHNFSVSAVLKNAIEWASRPYASAALNGKPVAMMGASNGMIGTARAQYHLRQMLVQTNSFPLNRPEVLITFAKEKFNAEGVLTDEKTLEKIKSLLVALVEWTVKLK